MVARSGYCLSLWVAIVPLGVAMQSETESNLEHPGGKMFGLGAYYIIVELCRDVAQMVSYVQGTLMAAFRSVSCHGIFVAKGASLLGPAAPRVAYHMLRWFERQFDLCLHTS